MIQLLEKLGDSLLTKFVPAITADAASRAGCFSLTCGPCQPSFDCTIRFKTCCDGVCNPCNERTACFSVPLCR